MTNGGIIEGGSTLRVGSSDLSPATSFPNGSMRVFHGAGTTDEENNAGQHSNRATTVWWIAGSGGGYGLWQATALKQMLPHYRRNPLSLYAEKEARLRPQHFTFGSGENCMRMQKNPVAWGLSGFSPPRS
jgi:hypothetical protein